MHKKEGYYIKRTYPAAPVTIATFPESLPLVIFIYVCCLVFNKDKEEKRKQKRNACFKKI
jgi:hypothetical protein